VDDTYEVLHLYWIFSPLQYLPVVWGAALRFLCPVPGVIPYVAQKTLFVLATEIAHGAIIRYPVKRDMLFQGMCYHTIATTLPRTKLALIIKVSFLAQHLEI
jgi:hypothetical protein